MGKGQGYNQAPAQCGAMGGLHIIWSAALWWHCRYPAELWAAREEAGKVAWRHWHNVGSSGSRYDPPRSVPERVPSGRSTATTAATSCLSAASASLSHGREDAGTRREGTVYSMRRRSVERRRRRSGRGSSVCWRDPCRLFLISDQRPPKLSVFLIAVV